MLSGAVEEVCIQEEARKGKMPEYDHSAAHKVNTVRLVAKAE